MIHFTWHPFADLTPSQLYVILALRNDVFVVEQNCPYLDVDGRDSDAFHLMGELDGALVAYLRLFPPTPTQKAVIFGRVVTARHVRTHGYGKKLLQSLLTYCENHFPEVNIQCSAQLYLKKFYESFGFKAQGEVYDEDNIPHIAMLKSK